MGASSAGSFENDDAADWVYALEEADGSIFLSRTLKKALKASELDLETAACAVAAGEVVAGLKQAARPDLPAIVEDWIAAHVGRHEKDLSSLALEALDRVRSDSELQELWDETGDTEWLAALDDLEERLRR